jgi:hypothetical protein
MFCCIYRALHGTVLLEKLIVTELIRKFLYFFNGTCSFIQCLHEPVASLCLEPDDSGHSKGITEGLMTH